MIIQIITFAILFLVFLFILIYRFNKSLKKRIEVKKDDLSFLPIFLNNRNLLNSFITFVKSENELDYFSLFLLDEKNNIINKKGILIAFSNNQSVTNCRNINMVVVANCKIKSLIDEPKSIKDVGFTFDSMIPCSIVNDENKYDTIDGLHKKGILNSYINNLIFLYNYDLKLVEFLKKEGLYNSYLEFLNLNVDK